MSPRTETASCSQHPQPYDALRNGRGETCIGRGATRPFFAAVYVYDFLLEKVQYSPADQFALVAFSSLASDHVRLFCPGEEGGTPILAPKKSTDWNTTKEVLGFPINTHTMRISMTQQKADAIREPLERDWPGIKKRARIREVLSVAGNSGT